MGNKESTANAKPKDLKELKKSTKFTEKELKQWYKDFLKAFPNGQVSRREFQEIYAQQFPHGNANEFADNVFRTFDKDGDKKLDFREFMTALDITGRAEPKDRLLWAFEMYDLDGSGHISLLECTDVVKGVLRMYTPTKDLDHAAKDLTLKIFRSIDKDHDGKLSKEEFVDGAKTDKTLFSLLAGKPVIE